MAASSCSTPAPISTFPGREHFYRRDLDPRRWLRVVVDFNDEPAWVVTALAQNNPPRGYKQ